jgi:hypothetical protein
MIDKKPIPGYRRVRGTKCFFVPAETFPETHWIFKDKALELRKTYNLIDTLK